MIKLADKYCRKCRQKLIKCPECGGKGRTYQSSGLLSGSSYKECPHCNGSGWRCTRCGADWG